MQTIVAMGLKQCSSMALADHNKAATLSIDIPFRQQYRWLSLAIIDKHNHGTDDV